MDKQGLERNNQDCLTSEQLDELEKQYNYDKGRILTSEQGVAIPLHAVVVSVSNIPDLLAMARRSLELEDTLRELVEAFDSPYQDVSEQWWERVNVMLDKARKLVPKP